MLQCKARSCWLNRTFYSKKILYNVSSSYIYNIQTSWWLTEVNYVIELLCAVYPLRLYQCHLFQRANLRNFTTWFCSLCISKNVFGKIHFNLYKVFSYLKRRSQMCRHSTGRKFLLLWDLSTSDPIHEVLRPQRPKKKIGTALLKWNDITELLKIVNYNLFCSTSAIKITETYWNPFTETDERVRHVDMMKM